MPNKSVREAVDATLAPRRADYQDYLAFPAENPLSVERAELLYIFDSYGNQFLDLSSSALVDALGHANPFVINAVLDHLNHYGHTSSGGDHLLRFQVEYAAALAESIQLNGHTPHVLFAESERDAVINAVRLALDGSNAPGIMAFGDYGWLRALRRDSPWVDLRPQMQPETEEWDDAGLVLIDLAGPGVELADKYWTQAAVVDTAKRRGVPVIVDESRTGFGRTGSLWAFEQWAIDPDYVIVGGPAGGGLPFGAVVALEERFPDLPPPARFAGYPVAAAAGLTAFSQVTPPLMEHVKEVGHVFEECIDELHLQFPHWVLGQQGIGLLRGIRINSAREPAAARRFWVDAHVHGLLLDYPEDRFVVPYTPSLIISESEVRRSVDAMAYVLVDWEPSS